MGPCLFVIWKGLFGTCSEVEIVCFWNTFRQMGWLVVPLVISTYLMLVFVSYKSVMHSVRLHKGTIKQPKELSQMSRSWPACNINGLPSMRSGSYRI